MNVHEVDRTKNILSLKRQEEIIDNWKIVRLEKLLPKAMKKADIPMWVVISKEYNEDPVVKSLTPSSFDSSGRLTILVFILEGKKVNKYFIGGSNPDLAKMYEVIWDRNKESQWECLKRLIENKKPARIGINDSINIAVADGLTRSLYQKLTEELDKCGSDLFVSSEELVIHWFQKRSEEEMRSYPFIADLTNNIARYALSNEVITPGITKTWEVVNWIRQRVADLGLKTSFYPTVDVQRKNSEIDRIYETTILPGDIVHLDFGIEYLELSTDTQQLAYVLKPEETEVPTGLCDALEKALMMEDIVMEELTPGRQGNDVFTTSIKNAKKNGLNATLYSHPIGHHCHEAGPVIGMYDKQAEIPFRGEIEVVANSSYALEFNVKEYIPEWGHETHIYLEQPIAVHETENSYLTPRQEHFYIIR